MNKIGYLAIGVGTLLAPALGTPALKASQGTTAVLANSIVPQGRNSIYGKVFGDLHRPVADVYVELLDDFNSSVSQTKTDGSGRFSFTGLVNGRYKVKAMPYGTDYMETTQEVTMASVSATAGSGSDTQHIDIYLRLNERASLGPFAAASGVIFVQDIPPAARKAYDEGLAFLRGKKEKEGFASLKKAIETFPNYYLALDRLGAEYAMRGATDRNYLEAGVLLLGKAVEVNPRGFSSLFGLGWIQYQLKMNAEAIESLKRAINVYERAADPHLWLGKALKRAKILDQAEVSLKRANELTKGRVSEIHWQLAKLYGDQKRYREAADELELFLKTVPKGEDTEKIRNLIKQLREKPGGKELRLT